MYRCFQQWSVEHSHTRRPVSGRPRRTDTRQDCARSGGRPNSIQGRNPWTCCNRCFTKDYWEPLACSRTRASGQSTTYTMTPPGTSNLVSWKCRLESGMTLLRSVMRVGFVCLRVMDVHVFGVDLVSVIFRSALAHDTQTPPQASCCGGHRLQLAVIFYVSAG